MAKTAADLLALQGKIKRDPDGYLDEFQMLYRHYGASLDIFLLKPTKDSREFGELVTFVAQVASCYPKETAGFSQQLMKLLDTHAGILDPVLCQTLVKALILLRNRGQVSATEVLPLFFRLFRCPSKALRTLLFRHIVSDIKACNQASRNDRLNRAVQNFLYEALRDENESAAKRSLAVLTELWRRQVWRDARTVNVIASAAMHPSPRIMLAAVKFFLGQDDFGDDDDSDEEEENTNVVAGPSKSEIYNAKNKGTVSSKKKKGKKLKRVIATLKKAARKDRNTQAEGFAAIQLLHDPQDFAEKLMARVQKGAGRFEVRLALMNCVSRVVGVHRLLLLNLYPLLQKYMQPHQRDVTHVLAALVQACHDLVPPETLAPVLRQLVDQFVNDRSRPGVMTVGIKTVREMCLRTPLVMTPDLLQDLAMYKKYREKEVAAAARGLIAVFRELAPGMLEKKDRGRGADLTAAPLAYGAGTLRDRVEGAELLEEAERREREEVERAGGESGEDDEGPSDNEAALEMREGEDSDAEAGSDIDEADDVEPCSDAENSDAEVGAASDADEPVGSDVESDGAGEPARPRPRHEGYAGCPPAAAAGDGDGDGAVDGGPPTEGGGQDAGAGAEPPAAPPDTISALKRALAQAKRKREVAEAAVELPIEQGRFLTEEDFERIKELRHQRLVDKAMAKHGLKSASKRARLQSMAEDEASELLRMQDRRSTAAERGLNPDALLGKHKARRDKAERLASVMEGRKDRDFGAASGRRKQKSGGSSNKEKAKRKAMPLAARAQQIRKRGPGKGGPKRNQFRGTKGRGYARS